MSMSPDDLIAARSYARALSRFACGGAKGRGKLDPVYVEVTQGRDSKPNWTHYSSCGDQLHWHSVKMGVPITTDWINRDDPASGKKWEFLNGRDNIGKLQHPGPATVTPTSYVPDAGDYLLCWHEDGQDVHVRICGNTNTGMLETFDYGAGGMSNSEFPGATCNQVKIGTIGQKLILINPKNGVHTVVQKVIPLPVILALSANLPSMTGEEIDALEKSVP